MTGPLLSLLLAAAPVSAQDGPRLTPAASRQLEEGLARLYELDYDGSRAAFRRLIELQPDDPMGYLFEAGGIWWQSSQEYGLFKDTPTLQGLFEQDVEAAVRKARDYIDSADPSLRADGYFASGMALGTRGQWNVMKGRWIAAYWDGKKAVKHLNKCLKLDPQYHDAYLGLGLFDYQTARFSGVARLGAALGGMRGDEARGLERITRAAEKSRISRPQAAQLLASLYILDRHDYASALPLIQGLRASFPRSVYFTFLEALLRHRLGDWDGSLALGRELFEAAAADPAAFRRKELTLVCGLSGADCLNRTDTERVLAWTGHALDSAAKEKPSAFQTWVRLLHAHALDLLGRREEAQSEYSRVTRLPDFDGARERARACLAKPCDRDALLNLLRERSRPAPPS